MPHAGKGQRRVYVNEALRAVVKFCEDPSGIKRGTTGGGQSEYLISFIICKKFLKWAGENVLFTP
jgi:hypothetical protein